MKRNETKQNETKRNETKKGTPIYEIPLIFLNMKVNES